MEKVIKLNCCWNIKGESDVWHGEAIVNNDGWFEGIVIDPNSNYKGDRFIFGYYIKNKRVELLKLAPINISYPLIFRVWGKGKIKYEGLIHVAGNIMEIKIGTVMIDIEELPEIDMANLSAKIQLYKDNMDERNNLFYVNTSNKKEMIIHSIIAELKNV